MNNAELVKKVNGELSTKLGYEPYFIDKNGKIRCSSCHKEIAADEKTMLKLININCDGKVYEVTKCLNCKYLGGINVPLKKRISDMRKHIGMYDVVGLKNNFTIPGQKYTFVDTEKQTNTTLTEAELVILYDERVKQLKNQNLLPITDDSGKSLESEKTNIKVETSETNPQSTDEVKVETKPTLSETTTSTMTEVKSEVDTGDKIETQEEVVKMDKESEKIVTGDEHDLGDIFKDPPETDDVVGNKETETTNTSNDNKIDDDLDIFSTSKEDGKITEEGDDLECFRDSSEDKKNENLNDNDTVGGYNPINDSGNTTDFKIINDPIIEQMCKQNKEESDDIFTSSKSKDMFDVVKRARINNLKETYDDSNVKVVVEKIETLFSKKVGMSLKSKVYINDLTHECPVVDFEGNVRLIFVDLDVPGGNYHIQKEINSRLKPTFSDSSEYEMLTYVILSDMIEDSKGIVRVVRAVAKNIAFNLNIKGVFNPISIIKDCNNYLYTTCDHDRETITKFDIENTAGNLDKPYNGSVAIVCKWDNSKTDDVWRYRKELQNRSILMRGGSIDYEDLSMFMTCSMRYIALPPKPDNTINVTIVDYVESLDLFVRDGFGVLAGVLIHNIKTQYPNSNINLYYELDSTMIPSPTISRYIKNGFLRNVNVNQEFMKMNDIMAKVANQNGIGNQNIPKLPVEGEPFDSPEYNAGCQKTYQLAPEFRRFTNDNKRLDWRRFGKKTFAKTLGERFSEFKSADLNDRNVRQSIAAKVGYQTIIQPEVIKLICDSGFQRNALLAVMNSCSGVFSISQYIKANRSAVVDDNANIGVNIPYNTFNPAFMNVNPQMNQQQTNNNPQMNAAMQQQMMWMMQQQFGCAPGFFGGNFQQYPNQQQQ